MGVAISTVAGRLMMTGLSAVGFHDVDDGVADADGVLELGAGVGLGRVLVVDLGVGEQLLVLLADLRAAYGDVEDAVLVETEHHAPLQRRGRVVEVHDRLLGAAQRLVGALDQLLAGLGEHLDHDVVGDQVFARSSIRTKSKSVWLAAGKPTSISL